MLDRTLIVGNSGSGKSTLARRVADKAQSMAIDLDTMHWEDDCYGRKRPESTARQLVAAAATADRWVIEGVYGWLAEVALPRATLLVWLDLSWIECRAGLVARHPRPGTTEADREALLRWAQAYWTRGTPSSFVGHLALFEGFQGEKIRLTSRDEASAFSGP